MNTHNGAEVHELVVFFLLNLLGQQYNTKQKTAAYIGTMDCQLLKTVVVHKWKRLRNA